MKAMVIERFGGPDVFQQRDVPDPPLLPGCVLIRVASSSANPIDTKVRAGLVPALAPPFPAVLHADVAGTVEAVGQGVMRLRPGDRVWAAAGGFRDLGGGALAEYLLADEAQVAAMPGSLSMIDAGALPLVGITAWEALIDRANIRAGQNVLIHGGAGGVGHVAVQLARSAGAIVHTTVSTDEKAQIARRLGADVVINYRQTPVGDYVARYAGGEGFDVVFDTVGGPSLAASFQAARAGGTVVTIAARSTQDLSPLHAKGLTLHVEFMLLGMRHHRARHGRILGMLSRLVDAGRLCPLLDPEVFAFSNVGAAHRKLESGGAIGKIRLDARW